MDLMVALGTGLSSIFMNTMPSARKSSAYFALPVTLARTSCGMKSLPIRLYAMSAYLRLRRAHDGVDVVVVSTAAAEIARHAAARLLSRGMRIGFQQPDCGHDL